MSGAGRHAWIDASAGVAGDMLLASLLDAGASLAAIRDSVDAVVPEAVEIAGEEVTRAGLRALHVRVGVLVEDPPHRSWRTIRDLLDAAALPSPVRERALAVFGRLAAAEGAVHGIDADEVHFHEVGALDSIADVVGVCAAVHDLGITSVSAGPVAVGSGRTGIAHGEVGVPVPAVLELAKGWRIRSGGAGELATPTGMALLVTLANRYEELPHLVVEGTGVGAGSKDLAGRANVTRVVLGRLVEPEPAGAEEPAALLEANVDDLDPRLWPAVLERLIAGGASDAWLVPALAKKGRPAHVLTVLCPPDRVQPLRELMIAETTTFGVRSHPVDKYALPRAWLTVPVAGADVAVKLAHRGGRIVRATPEFDEVRALAAATDRPVTEVLAQAVQAAAAAGLAPGLPLPAAARSVRVATAGDRSYLSK